ncbi:MAG: PAS domain S-box protein [Terriglobales bacterium]
MESHSEAFEQLLLELSGTTLERNDPRQLILSFCRLTRAFFHASGAYYWNCTPEGELVGVEADGQDAARFRGTRLRAEDSSVALTAVRNRRPVVLNESDLNGFDLNERDVNEPDPSKPETGQLGLAGFPISSDLHARTALAAPLLVAGEVIGAIAYLHAARAAFDEIAVSRVTILAAQLCTALEALRLNQLSREERRRAAILADLAARLHGSPDTSPVMENIADRLRDLLGSPAVLIFVQNENLFQLLAVSAEAPHLAKMIRARAQENDLRPALEIATRAVAAGERITVNIDGAAHFGEDSPAGTLVAAPFRTSRSPGAILVYPRLSAPFSEEEKTLVSALAGFGAVVAANAELYATARAQAQELHEILEISCELGSAGRLDQFMHTSVVRAASFLGFQRCFIGLLEESTFHVRWGFENGHARPVDIPLPDGVAVRKLKQKDVFLTEDAATTVGANLDFVAAFAIKQLLAVPLLGSNGEILGMFGVLDRVAPGPIGDQDVRRARALAAQVAIALEMTRNLHQSEEHRRRAETLVTIALELNTVLDLSEFMRNLALRTTALFGARGVALSLFQTPNLETVLLRGGIDVADKQLVRQFANALRTAVQKHTADVAFVPAVELLGSSLASSLEWADCTLVRLTGASGELLGVLCLADRGAAPAADDQQLLRAIAGHASVALENACLFTRVQQANRHWLDVFDAISDYIVVHDEQHNILRVNRALADMVGLAPEQLIGVNMRALDALSMAAPPHSCPFCRTGEGLDEYVHPGLDRAFLISTSRIHPENIGPAARWNDTASSAQLQTVHVLKDITDRRDAERRYRELFDNIQEGIYVSTPQGRFVEVNDALVRILGYDSREEVLQLDIPTQVYFSPQRRQELAEMLKKTGEMHDHEDVLRRKDGSPVHVYMNCYAVRDSAGNVLQHRGLMLDISGLRQSQTELQKERDFSSKILSHTQSLILVTDTAGIISYANRRWGGLGFQQTQLMAQDFADYCAAPRRDALRQALASVARGQQVDNFDLPLIRGDGASGQFSVNLSPIHGEDGKVSNIVVVMTDVTDSAALRAKLVHAEKMAAIGQLVSGVAHEVNNPLTAILGFADLLMENPELPASAHRDLRVILQEAQRTKQIVQNLLSVARQTPPRRQPVQLNSILQRTVQLRSYDFISHGIQVVERLDESLPEIVGDSHQLQQVFLNIINNAYDAVRECGRPARIEIMSARSSGYVEVSFRDNGTGIADPARIFEPFFTTKDVGKGTGLGLSICYGIVHEHGGEIICHNNLDSEGATFIVRLPLATDGATFGAAAGVYQP